MQSFKFLNLTHLSILLRGQTSFGVLVDVIFAFEFHGHSHGQIRKQNSGIRYRIINAINLLAINPTCWVTMTKNNTNLLQIQQCKNHFASF